jgi:hypothetical protein
MDLSLRAHDALEITRCRPKPFCLQYGGGSLEYGMSWRPKGRPGPWMFLPEFLPTWADRRAPCSTRRASECGFPPYPTRAPRPSKPVRRRNPSLGRFDSCAAPLDKFPCKWPHRGYMPRHVRPNERPP